MGADAGRGGFETSFEASCWSATSLEDLRRLMLEALAPAGVRFAALIARGGAGGLLLLNNYPAEWAQDVLRRRLYRYDPVLRYAAQSPDPFSWDDPRFLGGLSRPEGRMLNEARRFRIAHGYTVPLSAGALASASLSIVSDSGDIDPAAQHAAIRVGALILQRALLLQAREPSAPTWPQLSPRERACLLLKSKGLSEHEIAAHLGISHKTVGRHLGRARQHLNAPNREAVVYRALKSGQIS